MSEISNIFPRNAPDQLDKMTTGLNSTNDATKLLLETTRQLAEILKQSGITYIKIVEAQKGAVKVSGELNKQENIIKKNAEAINALNTNRAKTIAAQKVALQAKNKALRDSAKLEAANTKAKKENIIIAQAQKGAYDAIVAALTKNVAKWKSLTQAERDNTKAGQKLTATIKQQDAELKKLDSQIGRSQRHVGDYKGSVVGLEEKLKKLIETQRQTNITTKKGKEAFTKLGKQITSTQSTISNLTKKNKTFKDSLKGIATQLFVGLGVVAGIRAFIGVLKNAGKIIAQFDQAQATLAATLGTTKDKIEDLTDSSIELGRVTQFTATQVSTLQNELAKLGFTANEIKAATAGILDFAAATGAELSEAASVAGGALKAFGLEATQIDRVVSVMAIATTKSALQFSDFSTILGTAAPIANKYGLQIEDMIAVLGKLKDAQFDTSSASTAFRNILLKLSDPTSELSKRFNGAATTSDELFRRLKILKDEGANLAEILQITDVRAAGAFSTMIDSVEGINELKEAITGVNDELADMVETKTDNVIGAWNRLGSAWEGFILRFKESAGGFKEFFDETATLINAWGNDNISTWNKVTELIFRQATKQQRIQDELSKNLRTSTIKQLKLSIKIHEDTLKDGTKFQQNLLKMTKDRLVELEQSEIDSANRIKKDKKDKIDDEIKAKKEFEDRIAEMNKSAADKEVEKVNEKYDRLITEAQSFGIDITELEQMLADEIKQIRIDAETETNEAIKKERDKYFKDLRAKNKQFVKDGEIDGKKAIITENETIAASIESQDLLETDKLERRNNERKEGKKTVEQVINEEKEKEETKKLIQDAAFQAAGAISDALTDRKVANLQKEFDVLMLQKEAELAQENLTAEEKQKIEEKFAKKAAELKTKQAKAEKQGALISAIINTAKSVVSLGIITPQAILAGILGAIQIGIIAAQPIPQFAAGTHDKANTPSEFIAGEAKRELMKLSSGKVIMVDKPTHFKGNQFKGATIKSNPETEKILQQANSQNNINFDTEDLKRENKRNTRSIVRAINNDKYKQNRAISEAYKNQYL